MTRKRKEERYRGGRGRDMKREATIHIYFSVLNPKHCSDLVMEGKGKCRKKRKDVKEEVIIYRVYPRAFS